MKKPRKNLQGVLFSRCRSKTLILAKIYIFQPFQHAHLKCQTCLDGCILNVFKESALWADAFYKSKYPSVCGFVRVFVWVFVCLFTFEVPFKRLFAPTSQSCMSNILRGSESLGKSNGKKWSHIETFFFENFQKLPRAKKFFFC